MPSNTRCLPEPTEAWQWSRPQILQWQLDQFNRQLDAILPSNKFYAQKFADAGIDIRERLTDLEQIKQWPLTTKAELSESSLATGISQHQTFDACQYSRLHRTSGTRGQPLMILDTADDWHWWADTWQHVLQAAGVTSHDRVFLAFSFGPFIGFWSAHQACEDRGAMVIPGGGLSSLARLEFMRASAATVVCCTPTYALHLAEVAQAENFPLGDLPIRCLIVAGESGGSVPEVRQRICLAWNADVIDHAGATEVGPWGFGWPDRCGLHIIETSFIAEFLSLDSAASNSAEANLALSHNQSDDKVGELVLTSLGRLGAPVIRYRTGDIVRVSNQSPQSGRCNFTWLPEGAMGRADDMVTIRGVNIFPSSIEKLVRSVESIGEYQVHVTRQGHLDQLSLMVEANVDLCVQLEKLLLLKTGLRIVVQPVASGSLPRSEAKSKRWIDDRN